MYHYADGDVSRGPVSRDALRGKITPQTLVWREGMAEWVPAGSLPELADLFAASPAAPQPPVAPPTYAPPPQQQQPAFGPVAPPVAPPAYGPPGLSPISYQNAYPMTQGQAPGTATASLVLGICGIVFSCAYGLGIICAILALVFGYSARSSGAVGNNPGAGQATAGIVMGWIMVALDVIGIAFILLAIIAHS